MGDFSESPDIEHDNSQRPFEHIEEHGEWANDSESNRFEARLTKVERVAGQPKVDLTNDANQIVSVVRPIDQCLEFPICVRHPKKRAASSRVDATQDFIERAAGADAPSPLYFLGR